MIYMSDEHVPQFVDSNVLVYAFDTSANNKHARAAKLVADLWQTGAGCLSIQVLQEFYVTVTHKIPAPLSRSTATQIVADISAWPVHSPTTVDILEAIRLQERHNISFWDAMIVNSAVQLGCNLLWSENFSAGRLYGSIRVESPFS